MVSLFSGSGFLSSLAVGVCCWNILANWVKFLLGNLLGVEGLVSGTGFWGLGGVVSTGFGFFSSGFSSWLSWPNLGV